MNHFSKTVKNENFLIPKLCGQGECQGLCVLPSLSQVRMIIQTGVGTIAAPMPHRPSQSQNWQSLTQPIISVFWSELVH